MFQKIRIFLYSFFLCSFLFLSGCGTTGKEGVVSSAENSSLPPSSSEEKKEEGTIRSTIHTPLLPKAGESALYENEAVRLDASESSKGYVILDYHGTAEKVKLQIKLPDGTIYSYPLKQERIRSFPLTGGNGIYQISVLEHAYDDLYAVAFTQEIEVILEDEFLPFLYPNQFSWYDASSKATLLGISLSDKSSSDLEYLEQVYLWVTENISYDNEKAEQVTSDYVPDVDDTLGTGKGICFDYASLMVAMLRSQNIPTKLEVGYSGQVYHAWISVYLTDHGWVDNIIELKGNHWTLLDPTLASNNDKEAVSQYVGDGSNYTVKYHY